MKIINNDFLKRNIFFQREDILPVRSFGEVVLLVIEKRKNNKEFLSNGEDEKSPLKVGISNKLKKNRSNTIEKN